MSPLQGRCDVVTTLPNELLCDIIDLCRPADFEAPILTCKRFYQAARSLILEHNHCKNYSRDLVFEHAASGHIVVRTPFEFLEQIMAQPRNIQFDQLRYLKKLVLLANPDEFRFGPHIYFFDRMRESPQPYQSISTPVRELCYARNSSRYDHRDYNIDEVECRGEYNGPSLSRPFLYQYAVLGLTAIESLVADSLSGYVLSDSSRAQSLRHRAEGSL